MRIANISNQQTRLVEDYFSILDEYLSSVLEKYKKKNPDEAINHAWGGAIKTIDCVFIAQTLQTLRPKNILEIGSYIGFSTRWLLDKTKDWSPHVTSIDPNITHRIFENPREHFNAFCNQYKGRLKTIDAFLCSSYPGFPDIPVITEPIGEYDFAFIDGDHSFRSTVLNVALVARMMTQGGIIITHDALSWPEVVPAMETLSAASSEIDYYVLGTSFYGGNTYLPRKSIKASSRLLPPPPKPPKTLSLRKWNHYRIARRRASLIARRGRSLIPIWCDGLGIIKVHNGKKLADLNLDHLLAKKDEMLPQKDEIVKRRALPNDNLADLLSEWGLNHKS